MGGSHSVEEFATAVNLLNVDPMNLNEAGRLLHRYGDSYAHSHLSGDGGMYGGEGFTKEHAFAKEPDGSSTGVRPDKIYERPELYKQYVGNLAEIMAFRFDGNIENFDINKFNQLADYAALNQVSLIAC
jgi:hypothetical protein